MVAFSWKGQRSSGPGGPAARSRRTQQGTGRRGHVLAAIRSRIACRIQWACANLTRDFWIRKVVEWSGGVKFKSISLALLISSGCVPSASADSCSYPWSTDYRLQPGPWEFVIPGSTIDAGFFRSARSVVLLGKDENGFWLRTYQVSPPVTVSLIEERRDLLNPIALEVQGNYAYLLDDGYLRVFALGGAGKMYQEAQLWLEESPRRLAVRGDLAWAGGGLVMSQLDISVPRNPVVLQTAPSESSGGGILRAIDESAWIIGPGDFMEYFYTTGSGLEVRDPQVPYYPSRYYRINDIGWNSNGHMFVAAGVYFVRMRTSTSTDVVKVALVK